MHQPAPDPLTRTSVVDELEGALCEQILDGRLPAGALLPPERILAERHGVTRTSLRQALGRLERTGLIETRQGSGSRVRPIAESAGAQLLPLVTARRHGDWLGEVFEARRLLGALIARTAAARRRPEHSRRLRELVERLSSEGDPAAAQRLEADLHRALAEATGNRALGLLVNTVLAAYRPLHRRLRTAFGDPAAVAAELHPLVEHVVAGRRAAAERAALAYFAASEARMLPRLTRRDADA